MYRRGVRVVTRIYRATTRFQREFCYLHRAFVVVTDKILYRDRGTEAGQVCGELPPKLLH